MKRLGEMAGMKLLVRSILQLATLQLEVGHFEGMKA